MLLFIAPSGPPLDFNIDVNRTALNFSWTSPAENTLNGGSITSFTLICLVDDDIVFNETLSYRVYNFTIDFYSPSTTYSCRIHVTTELGNGPYSDYITVTTTDGKL